MKKEKQVNVGIMYRGQFENVKNGVVMFDKLLVKYLNKNPKVNLIKHDDTKIFPEIKKKIGVLTPLRYLKAKEFIEKNNLDIVQTNGVHYPSTRKFPLLKQRTKVKTIMVQHAILEKTNHLYDRVFHKYMETRGKRLLNATDLIIAVSENTKRVLVPYTSEDKIKVIYSGIDLNFFEELKNKEELRKKWRVNNKNVLYCIARLVPIKKMGLLIKSMKNIDAQLFIVGGGLLKIYYKWILPRVIGVNHKITFLENLNKEEIRELYTLSDIFVLLSKIEGLPIAIIESMACKTPVIASNVSGNPEIVKHGVNGILTTNENEGEDFIKNVNFLLKNKKLAKKMGEEGRRTVEKRFDVNLMKENYAKVYKELAEK